MQVMNRTDYSQWWAAYRNFKWESVVRTTY